MITNGWNSAGGVGNRSTITNGWNSASSVGAGGGRCSGVAGKYTGEDASQRGEGGSVLGLGEGGSLQRGLVAVDILVEVQGLLVMFVYCSRTRSTI
jgi:hypothetical protein